MELIAQFGLFNGILVLLLILIYSFRRSINKIFLGLSLFFVWYSLLIVQLNETGLILQYPFFERTGLLSAYLAFPFLFIYSRNTFYPGKLWRWFDWILLLPALIYIIDFAPFFFLPAEQKNAIWRENLSDYRKMLLAREGWLGLSGFHFTFIYIWVLIITYFQVRLISKNWLLESGFKSPHNRRLLYFIAMITAFYLPLFIPGIFGVLFHLSWFQPKFIAFTYGLSLSAIAIYVLIYPSILYGFLPETEHSFGNRVRIAMSDRVIPEATEKKETETLVNEVPEKEITLSIDETPVSEPESSPEVAIVLDHMNKEKPFRKQGFSIQDLSNQTGIPVYQLSPLINRYFKINFATWINRYRVEYFLEHAIENRNMTLEALAQDAGFTSRSTFINAFKKEKSVTPSEYLKNVSPDFNLSNTTSITK